MKRAMFGAGLMACTVLAVYGQDAGNPQEFEAASIKPTTQPDPAAGIMGGGMVRIRMGCTGGPGTDDPGRFDCAGVNLRMLMAQAWNVKNYQVAGPSTLDNERFDLVAKVPAGATRDQFRSMLQKLLADRFQMTTHHEDREYQVYGLSVAKSGHKLQVPKEGDTQTAMEAMMADRDGAMGPAAREAMGGAAGPGVRQMMMTTNARGGGGRGGHIATSMMNGRARMVGRRATMEDLVRSLSQQLDRPVVDQTGIEGEWNFSMEFSAEGLGNRDMAGMMAAVKARAAMAGGGGEPGAEAVDPSTAPTLPNALEKQLGLKLDSRKAPADTIVVDKVEKVPTEN